MKFSVLTIAAFAAANSGTFFCDVMAQETRAGSSRTLKASKKGKKNKCPESITETISFEDEIKKLHASVDHAKAKKGYDVFTAVRERHGKATMRAEGNIITDAEKEALNYGGKIYDGLHTADFNFVHEIMEGLADSNPEKLLNVMAPYLPVDSLEAIVPSRRRLFDWGFFGSALSCIGGTAASSAACTVGEAVTAGVDTPACVGAVVATTGSCLSLTQQFK